MPRRKIKVSWCLWPSAILALGAQVALGAPRHPCESQGKIVYQTSSIAACFDLTGQIGKLSSQAYSDIPEDLSGMKARGIRMPFSLANRNLSFADFNQAHLHGMAMDGGTFDEADLTGVVAWQSTWSAGSLRGATLIGAKLFGANFQSADLSGAKLNYADLSFADLRQSNLSGADLTSAAVMGTRFEGARFSNHTKLPFSKERAKASGMFAVSEDKE